METIKDKYKLEYLIGSGGFSEVYLATDLTNGEKLAIKKISLNQKSDIITKIDAEVKLMQKLRHKNIVEYYDVYRNETHWYIIMEYCNSGTFADVIKYNESQFKNKHIIREANTYYYLEQLREALIYIRKNNYIHRDIKPMNVLLTHQVIKGPRSDFDKISYDCSEKLIVKLADFGLAGYRESDASLFDTICGSPLYMAPELILEKKYNSKADLWAYGVIMYEMLFGSHPNKALTLKNLIDNLKHKKINFDGNKNYTLQCSDILVKLLDKVDKKRLNWESFLTHGWFLYWKENLDKRDSIPYHSHTGSLPDIHVSKDLIGKRLSIIPKSDNLTSIKISDHSLNIKPKTYSEYAASYPPIKSTLPIPISKPISIPLDKWKDPFSSDSFSYSPIKIAKSAPLANKSITSDSGSTFDFRSRIFRNSLKSPSRETLPIADGSPISVGSDVDIFEIDKMSSDKQ